MLMDKGMCAGLSIWYPRVTLMDAYSTDYYDISYPGLIMKVIKILMLKNFQFHGRIAKQGSKNTPRLTITFARKFRFQNAF